MKKQYIDSMYRWPRSWIQESDLSILIPGSDNKRHSLVKHALKSGLLHHIKRGLYTIEKPFKTELLDLFEIAQIIHGPSFISFVSALSYHQWIPEAVYTVTSTSIKRGQEYQTPHGIFSYTKVPNKHFYLGVHREVRGQAVYLMASPWRALSDYLYSYDRGWTSIADLEADLRIEPESLYESDRTELELLCNYYPNQRVRHFLKIVKRSLPHVY